MADDRIPINDTDYPFEPELSSEDEVLQELKRIIGEAEGFMPEPDFEVPAEPLHFDSVLIDEPVIESTTEFIHAELIQPELIRPELIDSDSIQPEFAQQEPASTGLIEPQLIQPALIQEEMLYPEPVQTEPDYQLLAVSELIQVESLEAADVEPELVERLSVVPAIEPASDADALQSASPLDASEFQLEEIIQSIDQALDQVAPIVDEEASHEVLAEISAGHARYMVFSLAGIKYAVPAAEVVEIGRVPAVTPVPNVPAWLLGVTNRRGDILSVVDLRSLLGVKGTSETDSGRIVVVRSASDDLMTGMVVDQVNGMLNVAPGTVQPPAGPLDTGVAPYMLGLCEHKSDLVTVLDLELVLASSEMRQFELA